jgi:hypothetical protein
VKKWGGKWCIEPASKANELNLREKEENERKSRWEEILLFFISSLLPLLLSSYTYLYTSLTSCSIGLLLGVIIPAVSLYNAASFSSNLFFFYSIEDVYTKLQMLVTSY